ncbi:hypothetical protein LEP1GSC050_0127 [Leptospira broomii serovar Hurstbridge str. 5399]|uniref:Uncharacterized protein n=1 Tax=Leptospira broomii serovar Hurstbridge str. 5399 TaxID=1049789 RepID=T0GMP2_9LEPT|nr:hypothetical protein [Leptospira broomii]EQA46603.1 hypothetical protein LEP1GSC050_0127 [Leptospira broomii serovar Hurstbridge str. 5399]
MKINSKENLAFIVSLLALVSGIADAKNILENLSLDNVFDFLAQTINGILDTYLTKEQTFSFLWALLLYCLYRKYIKFNEPYGVNESINESSVGRKIYEFSFRGLGKIVLKVKDFFLKVSFKDKLEYYFVFDRHQFAGAIGINGENIPPPETYDCEDIIIRIGFKEDDRTIHEEYRFVRDEFRLKVRKYIEREFSQEYGDFAITKFRFKNHFWILALIPGFFLKWFFKNNKLVTILLLVVIYLTIKLIY